MILSDADIKRRLEKGDLIIDPLDDPDLQIQPASVDLRLGDEFLEFRRTNIPCIHPNSEREVDEYVTKTTVEDGEFILHPSDFVLGTTAERVEIPTDLIAHVEGRSSLGRLAIVVHASLPYEEPIFLWTPDEGYGFYEIGAIVENERPACAVAFDPKTLRVSTHEVTDYITNPRDDIYRVTLESGRSVHVTKDHNLFTIDEWGRVSRIPSDHALGAHVMVPGHLPGPIGEETEIDLFSVLAGDDEVIAYATDGFGSITWSPDITQGLRHRYDSLNAAPLSCVSPGAAPANTDLGTADNDDRIPRHLDVTPVFGWVLGFYIANGSVRDTQVQFTITNGAQLDRITDWFVANGVTAHRSHHGASERFIVESALWSKIFRTIAGVGTEKTIPSRAWNWSDEVLASLMDGILGGDHPQHDSPYSFTTQNTTLANQLMYLGTRLRMGSSVSRRLELDAESSDQGECGTVWSVSVSDREYDDDRSSIPVPNALLRALRSDADLSVTAAAQQLGYPSLSSVSVVEHGVLRSIELDTLRRFRDVYAAAGADTTRLDHLLRKDVRFERVVAVERTDRNEVTYDLEVQPNGRVIENFLGGLGGVFLSNTAGLCDPGYRGQITLELSNLGSAPVALTPGMRVSQLTFTELTSPADRPYGTDRGSKYQDQSGPQASRIQSDHEFGGTQK